jgi:hypothetical protein
MTNLSDVPTYDSNEEINGFYNILRAYYTDIFTDENEQNVFYYLNDLKNSNYGNSFDNAMATVLSFHIKGNLFVENGDVDKSFSSILLSITETINVLNEIVNNNIYRGQYTTLDKIHLISIKDLDVKMKVSSKNSNTEFLIENHTLKIYHPDITPVEFSKYNYAYNDSPDASDYDIVKNYLNMLISYKDFNAKFKLNALQIFVPVMQICYEIYFLMESMYTKSILDTKLLTSGKLVDKMYDLKNSVGKLIKNVSKGGTYQYHVVNAICMDTCPVKLKVFGAKKPEEDIEDDERFMPLFVPLNVNIEDDYFIEINNIKYDITNAVYDDEYDGDEKKLTLLQIQAVGSDDNSCRKISEHMPFLDVKNNAEININLRSKNIMDAKSAYKETGSELKKLNAKLEKYKGQINRLVTNNNVQINIIKNIDIRLYVYYVILAIISIIYFGIFVIGVEKDAKRHIMILLLGIVMAMNGVNYFLNYDTIENFVDTVEKFTNKIVADVSETGTEGTVDVEAAIEGAIEKAVEYDENLSVLLPNPDLPETKEERLHLATKVNSYISVILTEVLKIYMMYLLSSESNNMYKTISKSLNNEKKTFRDHEQMYKYKIESDKRSLDIMKHEMIQKTGFINFVSIAFLIVMFVTLIYFYSDSAEQYYKIYIGIVILLLSLNLYQYYYTILHPVRSKARNKYWFSLADKSKQIM